MEVGATSLNSYGLTDVAEALKIGLFGVAAKRL